MHHPWKPILFLVGATAGCGHTATSRVALLSFGELEGKVISPAVVARATVAEGSDCGFRQSLAKATENALKGSPNDTLVDAEVTSSTGLLVLSNCITVRGQAIDSNELPRAEEPQD